MRSLAATEATRQVRAADAHRAVIDQATGITAARVGVSVEEAFELLRGASMRSNVKLRTLAERVVANLRRHPAGKDPGEAELAEIIGPEATHPSPAHDDLGR